MNLKEYIHSEIRNTLLEAVNEDRVNDFFYMDLKKHMWNRRKDYSNKIKKLNGLEKTEYLEDLYIKVNGIEGKSFAKDIKGNGIDLFKRLVKDKVIREDNQLDQAFNDAKPVDEKSEEEKAKYVKGYEPIEEKDSKRDYKKEYEKYGKSEKAKKYRAELNKYNRQKGTYGNGDGKDASHKGGKIVGFEAQSKNRGRREKSRLKKESVNEGYGDWIKAKNLTDIVKLSKQKKNATFYVTDDNNSRIGTFYLKNGKFAKATSANPNYDLQRNKTNLKDRSDVIYKYKVDESVAPNHDGNAAPYGSGYDKIEELKGVYEGTRCWKGYERKGFKEHPFSGKRVPNCVKAESVKEIKEGVMSDIHYLANKSKSEDEFIKIFFKDYGKQIKKSKESIEWVKGMYKDIKNESVNEEQLDEKLITFSNRAPYGQVVFMAGGAGSGKGFAKDNFIDGAGFRVRDVDEMKKLLGKLDGVKNYDMKKWYKKFGKNLSTKPPKKNPKGMSPRQHFEEFVLGKGMTISALSKDLKNPINVASLHYIVDAMGLKDKWLISMLSGKDNKETLPNLLFDITAKKVSSITDVLKPLMATGYDSKNVHLIWVLTNYKIAVERNKTRDRVVPDDILLTTHEGAGKTIWELLTNAIPKGLDGRIDVILNNSENTIYHIQPSIRKGKKVGVVSNFKSLSVKKQGGGITPEKVWKEELYQWIRKNAPQTLDLDQKINTAVIKKDEEYMI